MFAIDEIFLGAYEVPFYRCPFVDSASGDYLVQINAFQEKLNYAKLNPEFYDENSNFYNRTNVYSEKQFHANHLSKRPYFSLHNETWVLNSSGYGKLFVRDTITYQAELDNTSEYNFEKEMFQVVEPYKFSFHNSSYLWFEALLNLNADFDNISYLSVLPSHLVGSFVACSLGQNDLLHFKNRGVMLNFANITYSGGIPKSILKLNTGFRNYSSLNLPLYEYESVPGSDVLIRQYSVESVGHWVNSLLLAKQPTVLFNSRANRWILWFQVNDGLDHLPEVSTRFSCKCNQ